jgi:hypothetical protein
MESQNLATVSFVFGCLSGMKKFILSGLFICLSVTVFAQVRQANGNSIGAAPNSSAFFDASSSATWNLSSNVGKGMIFPRVKLSQFNSFSVGGSIGIANNYPTLFDGYMVYNTDSTGVAGLGQTQGILNKGFWYYENKSNSLTGGTWKPFDKENIVNDNILFVSTTSYSVLTDDGTLLIDVPTGGTDVVLPQASTSNAGKILTIRKIDKDNDILTFSEQIKYNSTDSFTTLNYVRSIVIQSDGINWWLIN